MRQPDDKLALHVQPLVGDGEKEHDLAGVDVDASTPESRKLHELIMRLGRHRSLRDPLNGICEDHQLTPTQLHALIWLGNDGPTNVGVLAQRIGITKKTITGVVDRLDHMHLVERTRDAEDRRAVVARLTQQGEALFLRINRSLDQGLRRMLDLLEPEDRESLFGLLERVLQRLGRNSTQAE